MLDAVSMGREERELDMPDHDHEPSGIIGLHIAQAVTNQRIEELKSMLSDLRTEVREMRSTYATRAELDEVRVSIKRVNDNLGWVIKLVLGALLIAMVGTVLVKSGVPLPK